MKQKLKALASLCLALALTLCLTLPAWAAGDERLAENSRGNVTIEGLPETSTENLKVTAYKIIEVNYYSVEDDEATTDVNESYDAPYDPAFDWVSVDAADDDSKSVAKWVRENYQAYIGLAEQGKEPDNSVQDVFKKDVSADFVAFYDDLANAIRMGTVTFAAGDTVVGDKSTIESPSAPSIILTPVAATDTSLATVTCNLNKFEMGSYLVLIEGGMKIYKPVVVNLTPKWENGAWTLSPDVPTDLTVKYSEPTITKTVKDTADGAKEERKYAQVDIGDTVTYTLVADVPQFPADAINKGYVISDDLPDGMTLGDVTVYGVKPVSGDGTTEVLLNRNQDATNADSDLTYTLTTPTAGETTVSRPDGVTGEKEVNYKIEFSNIVAIYEEGYTKVKVTYTATANEKILVVSNNGNTHVNQNTAYLDYNNNPYEKKADGSRTWKTASDTADVYTYGIKVQKQGEKQDGTKVDNLSGAVFELTAANSDGNYNSAADPISFVPVTPNTVDGAYRKAVTDNENSATTELEVGNTKNSGQLQLSGLDVGTYYLKEIKAPDGYNLLAQPVKITITDGGETDDGTTIPADGIVDDENATTGYVSGTTITNTQGFTLPTTGGMGTVLFTAGGVVLMGAGLVLLVVFLRRRRAK